LNRNAPGVKIFSVRAIHINWELAMEERRQRQLRPVTPTLIQIAPPPPPPPRERLPPLPVMEVEVEVEEWVEIVMNVIRKEDGNAVGQQDVLLVTLVSQTHLGQRKNIIVVTRKMERTREAANIAHRLMILMEILGQHASLLVVAMMLAALFKIVVQMHVQLSLLSRVGELEQGVYLPNLRKSIRGVVSVMALIVPLPRPDVISLIQKNVFVREKLIVFIIQKLANGDH